MPELTPEEWEALRQLSLGAGRWLLSDLILQRLVDLRLAQKDESGEVSLSSEGKTVLDHYMRT